MASFAIASNTSWSFFLDRDNGIFYEMLTYPMSRSEYLLGKVISMSSSPSVRPLSLLWSAVFVLGIRVQWTKLPLLLTAMAIGTAGMVFFYAIFALRIRRNDLFNSITSVFYFVFMFASFDVLSARATPSSKIEWKLPDSDGGCNAANHLPGDGIQERVDAETTRRRAERIKHRTGKHKNEIKDTGDAVEEVIAPDAQGEYGIEEKPSGRADGHGCQEQRSFVHWTRMPRTRTADHKSESGLTDGDEDIENELSRAGIRCGSWDR